MLEAEVGADRDMIFTKQVDHVADRLDDIVDGRIVAILHARGKQRETDNATGSGNGLHQLVGFVAWLVEQATRQHMGKGHRLLGIGNDIGGGLVAGRGTDHTEHPIRPWRRSVPCPSH